MALPASFDLRSSPTSIPCVGFQPLIHQGQCGACVAASLAAVLSIQACLATRNANATYSAQRIWDCYAGSCAAGVRSPLMDTFFPFTLSNSNMFAPRTPPHTDEYLTEGNYSSCKPPSASSLRLIGVQAHRSLGGGSGPSAYNTSAAKIALKTYIYTQRAPVMAIVRMTDAVFKSFTAPFTGAQTQAAFALGTPGPILHAVAVLGWRDADGAWLIQNSMGPSWHLRGVGWVLGPLHLEWYTFQLEPASAANQPAPDQPQLVADTPFFATAQPFRRSNNIDPQQLDLLVLLSTCLTVGILAWLVCFFYNAR
jgi:hypothetical protein